MIDLRSDTVTKPSDKMRAAMAAAEVGDDVYGEDPTVNRLQERAAEIFEKEAALFVPTGSMGNQIAVKVHTKPGQEIVIEERGHIFNYEMGAPAVLSGVTTRPVRSGDGSRPSYLGRDRRRPCIPTAALLPAATGLICLENTHNFAGGSVMTAEHCAEILHERSRSMACRSIMDGARIFNAAAALGNRWRTLRGIAIRSSFPCRKALGRRSVRSARVARILSTRHASGENASAAGCGRSAFSRPPD